MKENFAELFAESLRQQQLQSGSIIKGIIVAIERDNVVVNAGLKSEGIIPVDQFRNEKGELHINIGDEIEVAIETLEDGFGETWLSRERAKRVESWKHLITAHDANKNVIGVIIGKVKGGFTVDLDGVKAFLPGSLVDTRPLRDTSHIENRPLEFKVVKIDQRRNNIVVSRRLVIEEESSAERATILEGMEEGQELRGIVKNLTDYGAFIDLGGVDGLLHITDMSWKRIKHPGDILRIGDEIEVKVLKFDREKNRVSLGMKQLGEDPWQDIMRRYPIGARCSGKVTTVTDYGCFIELEDGVEGLVHMSEMDWTNKNINPTKVVSVGQEIDVMVLEIDEDRRRISLGMKQCSQNPWEVYAGEHEVGERITGQVKSITDFGIFIGLNDKLDGLVHLSDISWTEAGDEAVKAYKKGEEVEAVILAIDPEKERISLGIKQLTEDNLAKFAKNAIVKGTVVEVEEKQVKINLGEDVIGIIRTSELTHEKITDANEVVKVGDEIEARITNVDRKTNLISLSVKALEMQARKDTLRELSNTQAATTNLGDLLKQEMDKEQD